MVLGGLVFCNHGAWERLCRCARLTARRQPVDISVVAPKKGPCRFFSFYADVAELADALGSGPSGRKVVEVQVLSSAPKKSS